jgi:hypothetical protein
MAAIEKGKQTSLTNGLKIQTKRKTLKIGTKKKPFFSSSPFFLFSSLASFTAYYTYFFIVYDAPLTYPLDKR